MQSPEKAVAVVCLLVEATRQQSGPSVGQAESVHKVENYEDIQHVPQDIVHEGLKNCGSIGDEGERVLVLDSDLVNLPVVDTWKKNIQRRSQLPLGTKKDG